MHAATRVLFLVVVTCPPIGCTPIDEDMGPPPGTHADASDSGDAAGESSSDDSTATADDSTSATGDDATSADGSTTGASACGDGMCVPALAPEWSGPVALRDDTDGTGACDGAFATTASVVYDELVAPPAECTCACEPEGVPSCDPVTAISNYSGGACAGFLDDWNVTSSCNPAVSGAPGSGFAADPIPVQGVTCEPQSSETIAPAEFARTYSLCAADPPSACDDGGTCVPALERPDDSLCVWREGDYPCEPGWDAGRHLFHREILDERACTGCTCAAFEGECTGYTIYLFGTDECDEAPVASVTPGGCDDVGNLGVTAAERSGVGEPQLDCSGNALGGESIGAAGPTLPVTVCCAAP